MQNILEENKCQIKIHNENNINSLNSERNDHFDKKFTKPLTQEPQTFKIEEQQNMFTQISPSQSAPEQKSDLPSNEIINTQNQFISPMDHQNQAYMNQSNINIGLETQFEDSFTTSQLELYKNVESIAEYGAEIASNNSKNKFHNLFIWSRLLYTIEGILHLFSRNIKQIGIQNCSFSQFQSKRLIAYCFMNKNNQIGKDICSLFAHYFQFKIDDFIQQLNSTSLNININKDKIAFQIQTREIGQLIKALQYLTENWSNRWYFLFELKIQEVLIKLVHIQCPSDLKCSLSVNLPDLQSTQVLLGLVFGALAQLTFDLKHYKESIVVKHKVFEHLIPHILSLIQIPSQINNQINQISTSFSSISEICINSSSSNIGSLFLLNTLLVKTDIICKQTASTPGLEKVLVDLIKIKHRNNQTELQIYQQSQLNIKSLKCISSIVNYWNEDQLITIVKEFKIVQCMIQILSSEQSDKEKVNCLILDLLYNLIKILRSQHQEKQNYSPQTNLLQCIQEDIECNGGLEGIDCCQYNSQELKQDKVDEYAKITMSLIYNAMIVKFIII